jgi:hypothetical protein
MNALIGMRVRDGQGRNGFIAEASDSGLQIYWTDDSVLRPLVEHVSAPSQGLQVLTLTEGWKPMADEIGTARSRTLVEDLENLMAEADQLTEKKAAAPSAKPERATVKRSTGKSLEKKAREKRSARAKHLGRGRNPFKTKSKLGPGPRHGTNSQTNAWKCSCKSPYKCLCKSGKKKKTIRIGRGYKKAYNHEYKAWSKGQRSK